MEFGEVRICVLRLWSLKWGSRTNCYYLFKIHLLINVFPFTNLILSSVMGAKSYSGLYPEFSLWWANTLKDKQNVTCLLTDKTRFSLKLFWSLGRPDWLFLKTLNIIAFNFFLNFVIYVSYFLLNKNPSQTAWIVSRTRAVLHICLSWKGSNLLIDNFLLSSHHYASMIYEFSTGEVSSPSPLQRAQCTVKTKSMCASDCCCSVDWAATMHPYCVAPAMHHTPEPKSIQPWPGFPCSLRSFKSQLSCPSLEKVFPTLSFTGNHSFLFP